MNNPLMPQPYKILGMKRVTPIEWLFRVEFDRADELNYGQFIQISIPRVGEAPISVTEFNLEEQWIEFLIRKVGKVTNVLFDLKVGDEMFLRGPYGNGFPFDEKYKDKHLIVVAGGSGCGPVRSMVNAVHNNFAETQTMELILGFKEENCILFEEEIEAWRQKHHVITTVDQICKEGNCALGLSHGLVTEHFSKLDLTDMDQTEIVIVGPPKMMDVAAKQFVTMGVPEDKIWLSFERKMSCAVGKCGHCRIDETYVCLDGPVFNYTDGKYLVD